MLYDDGRTEHGKLEGTRPCQTGNVRFSRFIVNAGTEKFPFYKVIRGSDLGPGGAKTFYEKEWQNLFTRFDLTTRKQGMKQAAGCTIKNVSLCVEMPRQSSNRITKSGKPYRADLYIKVEYHTDEKKNPHAKSHLTVKWLTRTELSQLVGKKYAEAKEKILMERYKKKRMYFEECKKRRLNPETKKPLTNPEVEEYPWLFLEDATPPKANSSLPDSKDEDINTSDIHVDGDGESDLEL